jgi:diamine N-acetyltransferase
MSTVSLVDLTKHNWEAVSNLRVAPEQERFVAANLITIAESQFYPETQRKVILADGEIVGFIVYGLNSTEQTMWLHRFMVDVRYQGKGFGREALRQVVDEWRRTPDLPVIKVSYEPDNHVAERLYMEFGFVPGKIADWGERVATLQITGRSPS